MTEVAVLKLAGLEKSDRTQQAKGDHIQQLQQQIEAWQALLEKLAGNE